MFRSTLAVLASTSAILIISRPARPICPPRFSRLRRSPMRRRSRGRVFMSEVNSVG